MSFSVIGVGEVLWDLLPAGPQLGGAPANFAYHAHALGAEARVITRVGRDELGTGILRRLGDMGIADGTIQVGEEAPTGTVTVTLSPEGIPHFMIRENVAWDQLTATPQALAAVRESHAICFGTLGQRSKPARTAIQNLLAAAPSGALRVFDVNLRQNFFSNELLEQSLRLANVLKLNDGELPVLAGTFNLTGPVRSQIETIARNFSLQVVALTRGASGSLLFHAGIGHWSDQPSTPVQIMDTVGAGDAFTAALVMGLLHKMPLEEINTIAGEVARHVCSRTGATPPLPNGFRDRFSNREAAMKASGEKVATA